MMGPVKLALHNNRNWSCPFAAPSVGIGIEELSRSDADIVASQLIVNVVDRVIPIVCVAYRSVHKLNLIVPISQHQLGQIRKKVLHLFSE